MNKGILLLAALCFPFYSCIREEAPNAEADILSCTVPGDVLRAVPEIGNESVALYVRSEVDLKNLAPEFTITEGATLEPESGTARDFSSPQVYTVTSEDGLWHKNYTVRCVMSNIGTKYDFERVRMEPKNGRFQIFYDIFSEGDTVDWGSANAGYALTGMAASVADYPTTQAEDGYVGKCARLVTRSTGTFGSWVGMDLAAGNLFIGTFDASSALKNAPAATHFGKPFEQVPTYLSGYYKYKSGDQYLVNGQEVSGKRDKCDIYAVFYETDENTSYLDGTNALTHPNLVALARISDQKETDEWAHFNIPFVMQAGKEIDSLKLRNGVYRLGVVFSSSIHGDLFEGAIGSTLMIDEVEVSCE